MKLATLLAILALATSAVSAMATPFDGRGDYYGHGDRLGGRHHDWRGGPGYGEGRGGPGYGGSICEGTYYGGYNNGWQGSMQISAAGGNRINVVIRIDRQGTFYATGTCDRTGYESANLNYTVTTAVNSVVHQATLYGGTISGQQVGGWGFNFSR